MSAILNSPHFAITLTLLAYLAGHGLYRITGKPSFLQPVVSGIAIVGATLLVLDLDYSTYMEGASIIHFMLGTVTVALGLPLYQNLGLIRRHLMPLMVTLAVSGIVAAGSATGLLWLTGSDRATLMSMATKSITTPMAISVTESIGGHPPLATGFVMVTGILVAAFASPILSVTGVTSPAARGCAMGMIGHGVGTTRAFEMGSETGAFSALSIGLMGLYTAIGLGLLMP